MALFGILAITVLLTGWLAMGTLAWLAISVATRGNAGLGMLPLAWFTGVVAALIVPMLGFTGGGGLLSSFFVAFLAPLFLMTARRWAMRAQEPERTPEAAHAHEAK
jgi:hypothetical protein